MPHMPPATHAPLAMHAPVPRSPPPTIWSMSGRYASFWNVSLFFIIFLTCSLTFFFFTQCEWILKIILVPCLCMIGGRMVNNNKAFQWDVYCLLADRILLYPIFGSGGWGKGREGPVPTPLWSRGSCAPVLELEFRNCF